MGQITSEKTVNLRASDVSGQKEFTVSKVPRDSTVGELVNSLLAKMDLVLQDAAGRSLNYRARLDREGRHLNGSELVGDALESDDHIVLQPTINAG
jgi:hypothetical protein